MLNFGNFTILKSSVDNGWWVVHHNINIPTIIMMLPIVLYWTVYGFFALKSRLSFDLHIQVRQPFAQVFDHWVVQAYLPQNILPPHNPEDRGRIAGAVVDMDHWRSNVT